MQIKLKKFGTLRQRSSSEIRQSGISIGFECLDREMFDPEKCYDPLAASGVKWARCQTGWLRCEKQKGVFDFQWLDDIVDNLLKRGIQPWFNVGYGNPIYMEGVSAPAVGYVPLYYGDECLEAWKRYVTTLAKHFATRVRRWEIWNEPEGTHFWQPEKPSGAEYARFIRVTAPLIKNIIPNAEIGSSSNCVFGGGYSTEFIGTGIGEFLNFHCVHPYRVMPEENMDREIAVMRELFDSNGGKHVKLYQGEAGYASWFPENHWLHPYVSFSERNQAKWLLRRFLTDFRLGMELSSFFQMADMMGKEYKMSELSQANPARHGILNGITYTPKQSYYAISHLAALFDCDTIRKDLPCLLRTNVPREQPRSRLSDMAYQTVTFERNGYPVYAYYLPEDVQLEWDGLDNISFHSLLQTTPNKLTTPVLIDLLDGNIYHLEDIESNTSQTRLKGLPMRDYPLVLTDLNALEGLIENIASTTISAL